MSSDGTVILQVSDVSKCFEIYAKPIMRLYQTLCAGTKKFHRDFWALRNINFEVCRGERIGIVGRNGAGKSTLLQILAGTLTPTSGQVSVKGKLAALLELGSGFNPEFTGRENVYMSAAIVGMTSAEVKEKFQQIVAFADIGNFLEQPVKTYSSGMMVRLAFAVQIFMNPDILIVDEALSVGDAAFQRKCFARMNELLANGMTLLLVSHDTETIKQRCDRVIFLRDSMVAFDGPVEDGVVEYMRYLFPQEFLAATNNIPQENTTEEVHQSPDYVYEKKDLHSLETQWGVGGGAIQQVRIFGLEKPAIVHSPCRVIIEVTACWNKNFVMEKIRTEHLFPNMLVGIRLTDIKNTIIHGANNALEKTIINPLERDSAIVEFQLDLPTLKPGDLFLTVALGIGVMTSHIHLVWDDLAIHLQSRSNSLSDGLIYCPTKITVR